MYELSHMLSTLKGDITNVYLESKIGGLQFITDSSIHFSNYLIMNILNIIKTYY